MIPNLRSLRFVHAAPRRAFCRLAALAVVSSIAGLAACDRVPLVAPTGTTITLFTNAQVLPINGSADVTASVIEANGYPVQNGTTVTFTTSLGSVDPVEAKTQNGKAVVKLLAGRVSGTAEVNAFSGSSSAGATVSVLIGAAAVSNVLVSASPSTVPSTGGSVQLVATVQDEAGNALPGVPVNFTTDFGTLTPDVALSDANGQARSILNTFQTATVTATVGATEGTATVTATAVPTIRITPPDTTPSVGVSAAFTIEVTVGENAAPIRSVVINFGDGEQLSLGSATGSVTIPHTYRRSGTFTVTATVVDASGQTSSVSVPVDVFPAVPFAVTVTAPSGRVNQPVVITATPAAGAPAIVRYDWNFGDGTSTTTSVGSVPHIYTSISGPSQDFVVTVTAVGADGRTGVGSAIVRITP